ncbi:MAG: hypothetical protein NZ789_21185, partial [Pseudomonadales bacterium]|nr:hypothetical protein [Pseudomonadales bacterium]
VQSTSLEGHSGLIQHYISSLDPRYNGQRVSGISAKVYDNDEAGALIRSDGPLRVFEGGTADPSLVTLVYSIMLTRSPVDTVQIRAVPETLRESVSRAGGKGLRLRKQTDDNIGVYTDEGVTLLFDRTNWFTPQEIEIEAPEDFVAEARHFTHITHTAREGNSNDSGGEYNELTLPSIAVDVIDNDSAEVVIIRPDNKTTVSEQGENAEYEVVLSRQPLDNVVVAFSDTNGQIDPSAHISESISSLTFTSLDWNVPQTVYVKPVHDTINEGLHHDSIQHVITSDTADFYGVTATDVMKGLLGSIAVDGSNRFDAEYDDGDDAVDSNDLVVVTSRQAFSATFETPVGLAEVDPGQSTPAYQGTITFNLGDHDGITTDATEVAVGHTWTIALEGTEYSVTIENTDDDE